MSGDFVLQAGVCLPRGDEVGQGVWPGEPVFWMGYGKEQELRYLLSLGGVGKVAGCRWPFAQSREA